MGQNLWEFSKRIGQCWIDTEMIKADILEVTEINSIMMHR